MTNVVQKVKSVLPIATLSTFAASGAGESLMKIFSKGIFPLTIVLGFAWDYHST